MRILIEMLGERLRLICKHSNISKTHSRRDLYIEESINWIWSVGGKKKKQIHTKYLIKSLKILKYVAFSDRASQGQKLHMCQPFRVIIWLLYMKTGCVWGCQTYTTPIHWTEERGGNTVDHADTAIRFMVHLIPHLGKPCFVLKTTSRR